MKKPHVVILGAGASLATLPNGDKNGNILPLMNNLVEVVGLTELLKNNEVNYENRNFEDIYSELYGKSQFTSLIENINIRLREYFRSIQIPEKATIYDHLVLSLTDKDLIATFNWDPLLENAYFRNLNYGVKLPELVFLHGNVSIGHCQKCFVQGPHWGSCHKCNSPFEPTELLYPVTKKNYFNQDRTHAEWNKYRRHLNSAYMFTIFGYSAPKTDVEAVDAMKESWKNNPVLQYGEIEIITRPNFDEDKVYEPWKDFIVGHHYSIHGNFYDSWLARHPRRSCEAFWDQRMEGDRDTSPTPIPQNLTFPDLWHWIQEIDRKCSEN